MPNTRPPILQPAQRPTLTLFAIGMVGLGVLALIYRDFALVWQPVPAWVPGRAAIAVATGVLMLLCGIGLLIRPTAKLAAQILFPYLIAWALLKLPDLLTAPLVEGSWLGFGELAMLLAGGWTLFARLAPVSPASSSPSGSSPSASRTSSMPTPPPALSPPGSPSIASLLT